jgi:uncharacterized membrane protein YcaP (DUF421 family)
MMALREHGLVDVSEVEMAVLEVDGTVSVIPTTEQAKRTRRRIRGRKPAG